MTQPATALTSTSQSSLPALTVMLRGASQISSSDPQTHFETPWRRKCEEFPGALIPRLPS